MMQVASETRPRGSQRLALVARIAGWLLVAVASAYLGSVAITAVRQLPPGSLTPAMLPPLAAGALAYGGALLLLAAAMRILLGGVTGGAAPGFPEIARLYARSNIMKYLPGNIMHYAGRQALAAGLGLSQGAMAFVSVAEAGLMIGAAAVCVVIAGGPERLPEFLPVHSWMPAILAAMAVSLVAVVALVRPRITVRLGRLFVTNPNLWQAMAKALACYLLFFLLAGGILYLVATQAGLLPGSMSPTTVVSAFCLAWLVGFVVPGASAGLGIREAIMVLAFAPGMGEPAALVLALAARLVTTVADVVLFAAAVVPARPNR